MNTDTPRTDWARQVSVKTLDLEAQKLERELAEAKHVQGEYGKVIDGLREELKANHCKDCCCAQSWKALGVTEYDGRSIPEHITDLREELAALNGVVETLQSAKKNAYERMTNAEVECERLKSYGELGDRERTVLVQQRDEALKQILAWREDAESLAAAGKKVVILVTHYTDQCRMEQLQQALAAHERLLNPSPDVPAQSPPTPAA